MVFKLNTDGSGFTVLLEFESSTTGANPNAGLIQEQTAHCMAPHRAGATAEAVRYSG